MAKACRKDVAQLALRQLVFGGDSAEANQLMRPGVTERKPSRASTCSEYTADHTEIHEEMGE